MDAFAESVGEADLGDDPVLYLVEAPEKQVEVGLDLAVRLATGDVVYQLVLRDESVKSVVQRKRSVHRILAFTGAHEQGQKGEAKWITS